MPLLALKRLKLYISKKYFYPFGAKIADKNAYILVISSLLTSLISYSVVLQLIYPHRQSTASFIDGHAWQFSPHIAAIPTNIDTFNNKYIAQQIYIATTDQSAITKEQVKITFDIYQTLTESKVNLGDKTVSLKDICVTTSQSTCLVHSPLPFWNFRNLDNDLLDYKLTINKQMLNSDHSNHPYSTMSGVYFDQQGVFQSADAFILTFILKNNSMDVWNALWQHTQSKLNLFQSQLQADSHLIQFKWKLISMISWRMMMVISCAIGIFAYIRTLFSQTNILKSKSGLGISILFLSFACFTTTTGLLRYVKYETITPWPFQLLVCTTSTLGPALLLTHAVISRGKHIGRNERIGKGFQQVGVLMTSTLIGELTVLLVGSTMKDDSVKSFCLFASVALVVAYLLDLTLFTAILSIDIRRAELTDLGNDEDKKLENRSFDSFNQRFKSKRAINVLVLCFILIYLNVAKSSYTPPKQLSIAIDDNVKYKQLSSIADQFWKSLNPSFDTTWLEVRPPYIVFIGNNENELSITERLYHLQSTYNEKISILCSSIPLYESFMFDFLSPLVLLFLKINVPGILLSIIFIGIILWMIPSIRERIILPALRKIFVYVCLFLLRCIPRITPFKTDYLIRKVENDYNEDGMHMGAISMRSQFNKLQNQNCVHNVKIRTLAGKHVPDLDLLDASPLNIISTDQFGKIMLWDTDKNNWMARLDHLRSVNNNQWLAETNPEYFYDDDYDDYLDAVCKQVSRAHCVKIDQEGRWVSAGLDDGTILIWDIQSAQLFRELSVADKDDVTKLFIYNQNEKEGPRQRNNNEKHEQSMHTRLHDRVVKLEYLSNTHLLSVHKSGAFREWDINKGEVIQHIKSGHVREITNICVLTNNLNTKEQFIISSSKDGLIQCWKRYHGDEAEPQWKCMYGIREHVEITSLVAEQLHNGMGVLVAGFMNNAVKVWDLNYGNALCTLSKEGENRKAMPEEAEVGGPLLQFSRVVRNQPTLNNNSTSHILKQDMVVSDHTDSICQVAVTRIGNPEFENDCCPSCHVVINSGFFVASCSKDNTVHTWRLDRHTGKDVVGCTRCFRDYHRQQHYMNNRTWNTDAPPGTPITGFRYHKRNRKENLTSGDESEPDIIMERLSLLPKFLGKLDQVAGRGIVFCENMVLAGVRRHHSNREVNQWEAWFASLQYYEPPSLEKEASLIPVITFDLEGDDNSITEKEDITRRQPSLWEQFLFHIFGIRKVRLSPVNTAAVSSNSRPVRIMQHELKKKKKINTYINDDDDEAYDILPFSAIQKVVPIVNGFCCDYGNFIKIITFDSPTDRHNK